MTTNDGCLFRFLSLLGLTRPAQETTALSEHEPLPYRVSDQFISPAELSFYHVLKAVMGEEGIICPKVRLRDVFFIPAGNSYQRYHNYIAQKHVDFVVCEPKSMRPLFAIELDDSSHKADKRAERDSFVDKVFAAADLPLLHVRASATYNTEQVKALIQEQFNRSVTARDEASLPVQVTGTGEAPLCPKCGVPMVRRKASRGQRAGEEFYGCQNYPNCREIVPIR